MSEANTDTILDTAIVGAGVSGLYSGWRLLHAGHARGEPPSVTVFEADRRIGGRLLSLTPPGMPATRCELGGMRYMSRHKLVDWLVKSFGLATEPMPVALPSNIAYLRGQQFLLSDLNRPRALPYRFSALEARIVADPSAALLVNALQQIVPNCLALDYEALLLEMRKARFGGVRLHHLGFWNVLARILSPDAYNFVRDTGGYDCLVSNWSAADAIPFLLADFGAGVSYSRFPGGYEQLPQTLAAQFIEAGGTISCGARLQSFDACELPGGGQGVALRFDGGRVVNARRLVLAMPRRSLELLAPTGAVLDPAQHAVRRLIESVEPIPLFKIFLCYDYPWWKTAGVSSGRSITDLPIRQCYYWATEPKDPQTDGRSCLLASYDDDLSVSFWAGLRARTSETPVYEPTQAYGAPEPAADAWKAHRAPRAMVEEAHRQIVQMHGVSYAPPPYEAAYRDWAEDPYGGGVNFWRIHARSWEVIPAIVNPRPGLPVYICGEAYSHEQGWVEGALQTAEIMLQQRYHLAPPPPMRAAAGVAS